VVIYSVAQMVTASGRFFSH